MKILVAMSGGIDSSVVAHLLKEQGHEIMGVRFTLWTDPLAPALAQVLPSKCCNAQNISRADRVAKNLGIPLHILNLEQEFKRDIVDPFLNGFRSGLTPNPCIGCNRTIKFGRLLKFAKEMGCEKLATGHYARVAQEKELLSSLPRRGRARERGYEVPLYHTCIGSPTPNRTPPGGGTFHLLEAVDKSKDQSYFLYGLTQEQLSKVIFPLGSMLKKDVYELATKYAIPYEETSYRESQDLCFFPEKNPKAFLKRHLKKELKQGAVIRKSDSEAIGIHQGLPLYTMGQRHMGIGGQRIPLEVVQKDYSSNELIVDIKGKTQIKELKINSINWVRMIPSLHKKHPFEARTHSTSQKYPGKFEYQNDKGVFEFESLVGPQSPGQHLVLYKGEEIVGGGIIEFDIF